MKEMMMNNIKKYNQFFESKIPYKTYLSRVLLNNIGVSDVYLNDNKLNISKYNIDVNEILSEIFIGNKIQFKTKYKDIWLNDVIVEDVKLVGINETVYISVKINGEWEIINSTNLFTIYNYNENQPELLKLKKNSNMHKKASKYNII